MFDKLNKIGRKINNITYGISNISAVEKAIVKKDTRSLKKKIDNKIKNKLWNIIK
jgi:uncharacterized protein YdcH (DUF465 family)